MGRLLQFAFVAVTLAVTVLVYALKYDTGREAAAIVRLKQEIAGEREAIAVLKAEWSLLNQPDRLQRLADRFLELEPLTPVHVSAIEGIPRRPDRKGLEQLVLETLTSTAAFASTAPPPPRPKPTR